MGVCCQFQNTCSYIKFYFCFIIRMQKITEFVNSRLLENLRAPSRAKLGQTKS